MSSYFEYFYLQIEQAMNSRNDEALIPFLLPVFDRTIAWLLKKSFSCWNKNKSIRKPEGFASQELLFFVHFL